MLLSCTAIAWQCSPRVDIAEGDSNEAGESGEGATSGATFGGSPAGGRPSTGGEAGETSTFGGQAGASGSAGRGGSGPSVDPGGAGETSTGGTGPAGVCAPGVNQTCNDNPAASSLWGRCEPDETCTCNPGFVINPQTGRCTPSGADTPSACSLPKDPGNCKDPGLPRFYFDAATGACEEFLLYCGGKPRNANAFATRAECEASCIRPACDVPFVDGACDALIPVFSYNSATGACEPRTYGGCGGTPNRFASSADCEAACILPANASPAVVIQGRSCTGFGEQITQPGDESEFELEGSTLKRTLQWGCGCAKRPEFVMMYTPSDPVALRLCHDEGADICEANCTAELSWDLGAAFAAAGTEEFVFAE